MALTDQPNRRLTCAMPPEIPPERSLSKYPILEVSPPLHTKRLMRSLIANLRAVSGAIFKQLAPFPLKNDLTVPGFPWKEKAKRRRNHRCQSKVGRQKHLVGVESAQSVVPSAAIFLTPCMIVILDDSWT